MRKSLFSFQKLHLLFVEVVNQLNHDPIRKQVSHIHLIVLEIA